MENMALLIITCYAVFGTLGFFALLLKRKLITRGEFDSETARTDEWKQVSLRMIVLSERNATLTREAAQTLEEVVIRQKLPPPS